VEKQILGVVDRKEGGVQMSALQVCHSLPSSIATTIPLLVLKEEHEQLKSFCFLQVFLPCLLSDGSH
jgi:hypothetical protein